MSYFSVYELMRGNIVKTFGSIANVLQMNRENYKIVIYKIQNPILESY